VSLVPWKGKQHDRDDTTEMSPISSLRQEMDRLFDRFFGGAWDMTRELSSSWTNWMPAIDVSETESEVVVRAEVAGVDPKGIDVSLSGQTLTISGEKKESSETKDENCYRTERRFGSFRRVLQLPTSVDVEKVSAEHKNGVLTVHLRKLPGTQPKKIPVRSSGPESR